MPDDKNNRVGQILRYLLAVGSFGVGFIIFMAAMKFWFLHSIYAFFVGKATSSLGLDAMWAKLLSAILTVVALLAIPTITSFLFLGRNKRAFLIACAVIFALWAGGLFYISTNPIYFDRVSGGAARYYIKTTSEFKISSSPDYDPQTGLHFKPITPEIAREIEIWAKTGKVGNIPPIVAGQYFSKLTGEPLVWYAIDSDNNVRLFSLPGHDPSSGDKLLPVTKTIVSRYEKEQAAAAEQRRKNEEERLAEVNQRTQRLAEERRAKDEQQRQEAKEQERRQAEFEEIKSQEESANRPPSNQIKLLDNAPVKALHFLESGRNVPRDLSSIVYRTRFAQAATRFVCWDLEVAAYLNLFKQKQSFEIRAVWHKQDGKVFAENSTVFTYDPSALGGQHFLMGWGWDAPGHFEPGTYRVDLFVLDEKVASGVFEVVSGMQLASRDNRENIRDEDLQLLFPKLTRAAADTKTTREWITDDNLILRADFLGYNNRGCKYVRRRAWKNRRLVIDNRQEICN